MLALRICAALRAGGKSLIKDATTFLKPQLLCTKSEFLEGVFSAVLGVSLLSLRFTVISTQSPQRYTEGPQR